MDLLSVTASVIAVATAALQSPKALYDIVDRLVDAPRFVSQSRSLLSQTQTTLGALTRTLESISAAGAVDSVLQEIGFSKALESTDSSLPGVLYMPWTYGMQTKRRGLVSAGHSGI
jgi:hypothetical protein